MDKHSFLNKIKEALSDKTVYRFNLDGNGTCATLEASLEEFCYTLALCNQTVNGKNNFIFNLSCSFGGITNTVDESTELDEEDVRAKIASIQDFLLEQIIVICYVNKLTGNNITTFSWPHLKSSMHSYNRFLYKEARRTTINPKHGF
jgi:hypothetical protein